MKRVIFTVSFVACIAALGYCQDTLSIVQSHVTPADSLEEIDVRELPEIIKKNISGEDFSSWIFEKAYRTSNNHRTDQEESSYYIVELRKGDQTIHVWFDEQGNKKND